MSDSIELYRTAANLEARIALHRRFGTIPFHWQRGVFDPLLHLPITAILEVGAGNGLL
jgi:hypothetical protein